MQIGLVGVGKMGKGLQKRWQSAGHEVVVFDTDAKNVAAIQELGGQVQESLARLVHALKAPRTIWIMIPAGEPVMQVIAELSHMLDAGDVVIDGGNSHWQHSQRHARQLAKRNIHFIDVGVSGGVAGATTGYALMIGGDHDTVKRTWSLFEALAAPNAVAYVGPSAAGHYVKMVHNAIEYGMMQSIAEGFDLLQNGSYDSLDLPAIAELWSHGTIVRSYLMELTATSLATDTQLEGVAGYVEDNGEGRWAVHEAVERAVPFSVNTAALYARFISRNPDAFSAKLIAALRREFGGHDVRSDT